MEDDKLKELIRNEVTPDLVEKTLDLLMPSVRLRTITPDESAQQIGVSRIGGLPDLPTGTQWPMVGKHALYFIAQINLVDVSPFDYENRLPKIGLLSFFYGRGANKNCVIYIKDDQNDLSPCNPPPQLSDSISPSWFSKLLLGKRPERVFRGCRISFNRELTPPDGMSFALDALSNDLVYSEEFYDKYYKLLGEKETDPHHQLLGNPASIQGAYMEAECAGIQLGKGPLTAEQLSQMSQWKLLAQFDSDDLPGMMWGDLGRLYYYIHESDLSTGEFNRVFVTIQCY
jgi:uncharacterized protein YwqG